MDLALRLTLLGLLLQPIGDYRLRPLVLAFAAAGLVFPGLLRSRALWLTLTGLTAVRVVLAWPLADNHAYLLSYWCLAIGLALAAPNAGDHLAGNARWLVGFVFLLAVGWKLAAPDYLDGTFFQVTLLVDERLEGFTRLAGGLSVEVLERDRILLERHVDGPASVAASEATLLPRFRWLAGLSTGWTLAIEAAVAFSFLCGPARLRHATLLAFCVTVYAVAPVAGFGWLLVAMGLAQCTPGESRMRALYVAAFGLILFYREVPWATLIADCVVTTLPG